MSRLFSIVLIAAGLLALAAGCSHEPQIPGSSVDLTTDKDGTESLGPPSIPVAAGSGFVEGGVGMVGVTSADLTLDVPAGAAIAQVLLYWAGGTTAAAGDDEISLDGTLIQGELIGGPTLFFSNYRFSAYRADITHLGLVGAGANTLTVADFDFTGADTDENNGASVLVIYDDGGAADLSLRDGLDMAYFGFEPDLNATDPQVFAVVPADVDRVAELVLFVGSVGENRPNQVRVTTAAGEQLFDNPLGSFDGLQWDSVVLEVAIAAGESELAVELVSTQTEAPLGASLGWVAAGLAVPVPLVPDQEISGSVYVDTDRDGVRSEIEWGIPGVVITLTDAEGEATLTTSGVQGAYSFAVPAGTYTVSIDLSTDPEAFNIDIAESFDPTTPVSIEVTVGPDSAGNNFGFEPRVDQILLDLDSGELQSDALSPRTWRKLFRRGIIEENSNRPGHGHRHDKGGGWGHDEDYFDAAELHEILAQVQALYFPEPYQFPSGDELQAAYDLIHDRPNTLEEELLQELFVTELNYVVELGLIEEADRLGVLISWGESLLNDPGGVAKASPADLINAIRVFDAVNTGGGGSVDE